jgi:methylphosphotriester-DNA--protein-cysteine methyltransferase
MGRICTICAHPAGDAIDEALETDRALRDIAVHFGVSKTALHRHWQAHVSEQPMQPLSQIETLATGDAVKRGSRFRTFVKWGLAIGVGVLVCVGYARRLPPPR